MINFDIFLDYIVIPYFILSCLIVSICMLFLLIFNKER